MFLGFRDYLDVGVSSSKALKGGEEDLAVRPELAEHANQAWPASAYIRASESCLYYTVMN
jgi:hypothetical protein